MKRRILLFAILALLCCARSFGQPIPVPDSLVFGVAETDTLRYDTIPCYPYNCPVEKMHAYELPYAFDGVIDISGDPETLYKIKLLTAHDSVHFDTCVTLSPFAGQQYRIFVTIIADCQIAIAGPEGAVIIVTAKLDTSTTHHHLPQTFLLLDTLCNSLSILEPIRTEKWVYFDPISFRQVSDLQPNAYYLKRKALE